MVFCIEVIVCTFSTLYYSFWYDSNRKLLPYLYITLNGTQNDSFAYNLFLRFFSWILIFAKFVPISLLVTLEMVKFFIAFIMIYDPNLKYNDIDCSV